MPFDQLPDEPNVVYAVWVDTSGADDLSAASPDPIVAGIVYVGECVTQSPRRHLAVSGRDIGSLTLMKNLAALFRDDWTPRAEGRGATLREPTTADRGMAAGEDGSAAVPLRAAGAAG